MNADALWPDYARAARRVTLDAAADEAALRTVLDRYALNSEIKARL